MKTVKKINKISLCIYIISAVLLLAAIPPVADISYGVFRQINKSKGYSVDQLFQSFTGKDYIQLQKQIKFNVAIDRDITDEDRDFYLFVECYERAVNYNMYTRIGDEANAVRELKAFNEAADGINRRIVSDALKSIRETYKISG